jgi:hypothetical protein
MGKIALVATVGPTDNGIEIKGQTYMGIGEVALFKHHNVQDVSVHEFIASLKKLRLEPSELAMDLLVIACTMYAADTRIKRDVYAEDSWTRMIDLFIPVSDISFWNEQKELVQKIFRFLTGDIWKLTFRDRTDVNLRLSPKGRLSRYGMPYQTDTVCLFSGGMDSFIGAIDLLESGVRPLLVGHTKSSDVKPYQDKCYAALIDHYQAKEPSRIHAFIRIPNKKLFGMEDHTERGRSFLFLTLGCICASGLNEQSKLVVPENGMISLNIPLTPLRVGSHSTRTTHPYYFGMMQHLFNKMQNGVTILNPYQFKTKGEMLSQCANQQLVANTETMSCSHPSGRWAGEGNGHCGYCVPCIIRQASFKAAGLVEQFHYRRNIFDPSGLVISKAEGANVLAFKYLIEKIRRNPIFLTTAIRNTGPLGENVELYIDVYARALREVENLINPIVLI